MPMYINATTSQMEPWKQEAAAQISISYILLNYVGRGVWIYVSGTVLPRENLDMRSSDSC